MTLGTDFFYLTVDEYIDQANFECIFKTNFFPAKFLIVIGTPR